MRHGNVVVRFHGRIINRQVSLCVLISLRFVQPSIYRRELMKTQDAPQKLADSAASHLQVPARYRFLRSLVLSILLAFLLETGTLIGAPVASPLVLSDWRPKRMLVFFVLSLLFVLWLTSSTMCHARSKWLNSLRGIEPMRARRITCNLLIL